ncbi:OadG family protein [Desulfosediminicola flagellatus]|uniref:OadG family protein n=1 Tax=Desulfosediminicola flagellatus TaxID=2569541 RepID=UPI0010ABC396|nr:OadG family protein [Desulfosediminicola flagellatus]
MILEGVKLMFVGMTTVVLFLIFMIFLIQLVSHLTRGATARELEAIKLERELLARSRKEKKSSQDADDDIAVIAAAVAAFEAEKFAHG